MKVPTLYQIIETIIKERGGSARSHSLAAGVDQDTIRNIKRGHKPSLESLAKLARHFEVPLSRFSEALAGDEQPKPDDLNPDGTTPSDPPGYVGIPTMGTRAGMGGGGFGEDDMLNGPTMLPERLIRTELRGEPLDFVVMEVEGQSMQPILESGDQVLVDRRKKNPSNGGLFALWDGFGIVVKWVERVANSNPPSLRIASENKVFQPYEILAEEANIIGRIVWFARKL